MTAISGHGVSVLTLVSYPPLFSYINYVRSNGYIALPRLVRAQSINFVSVVLRVVFEGVFYSSAYIYFTGSSISLG